MHRFPRERVRALFTNRARSRVATRSSRSLPRTHNRVNFLSHRRRGLPRNRSRFCNRAHCRPLFLSLISAPVCARVASRARACAETILRRECNCHPCNPGRGRYGFLSGETRTSISRTFPSPVVVVVVAHCVAARGRDCSLSFRRRFPVTGL